MLLLTPQQDVRAQIETLVMPGKVISGHADLESECSNCHKKFERGKQRELCLDCHDDVAADLKSERGFHGLPGNARTQECASCHTDHEGRDADILGAIGFENASAGE